MVLRRTMLGLSLLGALAAGCFGVSTRGPSVPQGAPAPAFELRSHQGEQVSLDSLVARGPAVVIFYRGFW
jgi:hypothetical protein